VKKLMALMLAMLMAAASFGGFAEESVFETLEGIEWTFSSGVGAWSTDLRILPDGSFSGEYHDSDMGDTGEGYPNGTYYLCSFFGRMSLVEKVDDYCWKLRVDELKKDESQEAEYIDEGIRYVAADSYGISEGDEMLLCRPGTPLERFSEEMLFWTHTMDLETKPDVLEDWFLCSEKNMSGFVGYRVENEVGMINPWKECASIEELQKLAGVRMAVPEDAENVIFRYAESVGLAEILFNFEEADFCGRAMASDLKTNAPADISGMYFEWENVENVNIGPCPGTIGQAKTGSEDWVQRCLWYDAEQGVVYSMSVSTTDLDGLDLIAFAEQMYVPAK